ncbi:hypothetical protein CHLRE_17g732200v5 [Chlamydomonas reinhardtii]|uniref:Uncharacterized protein n=1 Tax=Chlamydomonas reinhardtii TaxID=3055 RepID=A8JFD7_CHLRE|nr:uncharacterized protein CHLRE_17g732200v5 [Chlamydomonas reinhardtii]PNW70730.1 hypothetical protein CHLRE_17g732200v5 [Chlamydomonas reinhardtii]|eukprot:XP_001701528.1 predicted protein [Chlamydomonas reinhardtii]
MFRRTPSTAEQTHAAVGQLVDGAMVLPELLDIEPQKGLVAVMEHVQKCVPAAAAATRVLARKAHEAELVAEELEEVATALHEHSEAGAPAVARMKQRLDQALQALQARPGAAGAAPGSMDPAAPAVAAAAPDPAAHADASSPAPTPAPRPVSQAPGGLVTPCG